MWSAQRIPTSVKLGFLDRSPYFLEIAPQLSSRGWVSPVPETQLLRKSGNPENRTGDLWICRQELWPLDHRGGRSQGKPKQKSHKNTCYRIRTNSSYFLNQRIISPMVDLEFNFVPLSLKFNLNKRGICEWNVHIFPIYSLIFFCLISFNIRAPHTQIYC
jgi:hypothetical protein